MIKRCLLLLIICFLVANGYENLTKNLRNLEIKTQATISESTKLKNENGKLKFSISLSQTTDLVSGQNYDLNILDKDGKKSATCTYDNSKFNCEYDNTNYFGPILVLKNTISLGNEKTFEITNQLKLQQTVELKYDKAYVEYAEGTGSSGIYNIKIYVKDQGIAENSFYQIDILNNGKNDVSNCTYTSSSDGKYLNCKHAGNNRRLVQLSDTQKDGSVKWVKDDTVDFKKEVLIKNEVEKIYGYNLNFEDNQWKFYTHVGKLNVVAEGYYYTMNVLINKDPDSSDIKSTAICKTIDYHSECTIQSNLAQSELSKEQNYLIYISNDQASCSIIVKDNSLSEKKIISRIMTLEFVKAYELKYENKAWKFKIEIANDGLRDGLNVTVDLNSGSSESGGSCLLSSKVLSCQKDPVSYQEELIYLSFKKKYGSITWSNKDENSEKIKMALDRTLSYINSYYLKYDESNGKWTFKLAVKNTTLLIPGDSLITVDILYDENKNTLAECEGNNKTSTGYYTATFSCECELTKEQIPKINKDRISGSVTWEGLTDSASIAKKLEFKFVDAYGLEFITSDKKWFFDVEFEDTENLSPSSTEKYYLDMNYDTGSGSTLKHVLAECSLKEEGINIFSCSAKFNNVNAKNYKLHFTYPAFSVDSNVINWIEGIDDNYEFGLKTELNYEKGIISYDSDSSSWVINIDISGKSSDIPVNSRIVLDIIKDESEDKIECIIASDVLLKCDTKISDTSAENLPSFSLNRKGSSGVIWKNEETNDDFYYFLLIISLKYESADLLNFVNNKWQFKLHTSSFPARMKIIIDILYDNSDSTATCVKELLNILCTVDETNQNENVVVKIKHEKGSESTVSWNNLSEDQEISKLTEADIKEVEFKSVYDFILNEDNWEFKIELTKSNLQESDNPIEIDIKFNEQLDKASCTITPPSLVLACKKAKRNSNDRIILTNNNENIDLVWTNLNEDIELFVSLDIKIVNTYGGFRQDKWVFNIKYELSSGDIIDVNNNYALLDILVNSEENIAKCEIIGKFLLCESQHDSQSADDKIEIYGTKKSGTITISSGLTDNNKTLKPISITIENPEISDYNYINGLINFDIEGNLKENEESEIAENTITEVKIIIIKKDESQEEKSAICLTNEVDGDNNLIKLSCELTGKINKKEDNIYIKVDSDGKSDYVTFSSITENIKINSTKGNNWFKRKFMLILFMVLGIIIVILHHKRHD